MSGAQSVWVLVAMKGGKVEGVRNICALEDEILLVGHKVIICKYVCDKVCLRKEDIKDAYMEDRCYNCLVNKKIASLRRKL